mgnify:CR=1 FL=1
MENAWTIASLIASVASFVLAGVAIWIALWAKGQADQTNRETRELLTEIKSDAKAVAQYALPELKAYGDSVRQFVFQKEDTQSTSRVSNLEKVLAESQDRTQRQIEEIRQASDVEAVRAKLDELEAQLRSSQESVRESVKKPAHVMVRGVTPPYVFYPDNWRHFLSHLNASTEYTLANYGSKWVFEVEETGKRLEKAAIIERRPFSALQLGDGADLSIVKLDEPPS